MKAIALIAASSICLSALGQAQQTPPQANAAQASPAKSKVMAPKLIDGPDPAPTFDEGKGPTIFTATIGTDGLVHDPKMIKSSDSKKADANALEAVKKWKYKPATRDGVPVPVVITIQVDSRAR